MEEDLGEVPPPPAAKQLPGLARMGRKKDNSCAATGHLYQELTRWGSGASLAAKMVCLKCGAAIIIQ